ncbi:thiamine diphosphokinase [Candidatus Uabimicrobium sp. HlEnr_7]|uniref:thiamine diphosphokinase n=1 Tax=Candidatus Uabimicrobium helgolandensis TaxID=3095367 RepID=UPI00355625A6
MSKVAIMSGGTTPQEDHFFKSLLPNYQFYVAVDMGMDVFHRLGIKPNILVGDLDSISSDIDIEGIELHKFPCDKDKTDTELAVDYCNSSGFSHIDILGGIGDRLDHTLANAYLLVYANKPNNRVRLLNSINTIYLLTAAKAVEIKGKENDIVSLIPITENIEGLTIRGCRWNLEKGSISQGRTHGLSNYLKNTTANLSIAKGMTFVFHIQSRSEKI